MTISVRESGMPMTVSRNSPSTNVRPSTSRPSPAKNAVTVSRSATVMPHGRSVVRVTWVHPPITRLVNPLQGRGRRGGLDIGHEDFKDASHPRRSASSVPTPKSRPRGVLQLAPGYRQASHLHDVRRGQAQLACFWLLVRRIHPSPQPAPNLRDRLEPTGVFDAGAAGERRYRKNPGTAHRDSTK